VEAKLVNPDGQGAIGPNAFTYVVPLTAGAVSPLFNYENGGGTISITGTGFVTGAVVSVGGSSCTTVKVVSSTRITCVVPPHAAGRVDVVVTNSDGRVFTFKGGFVYLEPTAAMPVTGGSNSAVIVFAASMIVIGLVMRRFAVRR
jgi:hypothetical protein